MPDIDTGAILRKLDSIEGINGPFTDPTFLAGLRELDVMNKDLFGRISDSLPSFLDGSEPEKLTEDGQDGLQAIARHLNTTAPQSRLVPVDRIVAALHVYSARMTFGVIPEVWGEQLLGIIISFVEAKAGAFFAKSLVKKAFTKTGFVRGVIDLLQGVFSTPEKIRIMNLITRKIEAEGAKVIEPFIPKSKHDLAAVIAIPQLSRAGFLRHPPSHGAPGIGLDGKVRGRPRKVRDIQTRHKFPVKDNRYKKTRFF